MRNLDLFDLVQRVSSQPTRRIIRRRVPTLTPSDPRTVRQPFVILREGRMVGRKRYASEAVANRVNQALARPGIVVNQLAG